MSDDGLGFPAGYWTWSDERRELWNAAHPEFFSPIEDRMELDGTPIGNVVPIRRQRVKIWTGARMHVSEAPDTTPGGEKFDDARQDERFDDGRDRSDPPPNLGEAPPALPPPPLREGLLLSAWIDREIPPRDYLLGGVMCSTSRWLIFGETGIGKTLFAMSLIGGASSGRGFLKWSGQRKARVMYLDGDLPIETFKERMQLVADLYGREIEVFGYNRDHLGDDAMPALNTDLGQTWLRREIEAIKPDIIVFDSIMCLLGGSSMDEESWAPMKPFIRWLSSRRIAQIWLHHANDIGKSFGTKTREWEMDTVIFLSRPIGEDGERDESAIKLEFRKRRLCTPANADQFEPIVIYPGDIWQFEAVDRSASKSKSLSAAAKLSRQLLEAYDRLADGVEKSQGFDGKLVRKVSVDAIRDELKSRGFLDVDERGRITGAARKALCKAKTDLLGPGGKLVEKDGNAWRP